MAGVVRENPKPDYGHTTMAFAETLTALGETDLALGVWQHVTAHPPYPRAKVQLAELYRSKGQPDLARAELKDVLADDPPASAFQRRRDRVEVNRAKSLMRKIGG